MISAGWCLRKLLSSVFLLITEREFHCIILILVCVLRLNVIGGI